MPVIPPGLTYSVETSGAKLIKRALRLLGVLASGTQLSALELEEGLEALNSMLDAWNSEELNTFSRYAIETALVADQQSYTIGINCDIDTAWPEKIEQGQAFYKVDGVEYPLEVLNSDQWNEIAQKDVAATQPCKLFYDREFPYGNVSLYPKPDSGSLVLYLVLPLVQITQPSVPFVLPPSYAEAIAYNLAVRLAPENGKTVPVEVGVIAVESKANLKRANFEAPVMACDSALMQNTLGSFNIWTGN